MANAQRAQRRRDLQPQKGAAGGTFDAKMIKVALHPVKKDELGIYLNPVRPAELHEEPDRDLVRYLTHHGQKGAKERACTTKLDTAGVLIMKQQSEQHFRSVRCNGTLMAFKQESIMSLSDAASRYWSRMDGGDADDSYVESAEHCEKVIAMLMD